MSEIIEVTIKKKTVWTPDLLTLQLDCVDERFEAGQFFNLAMKTSDLIVRRSYSAASAPGKPLEFFISRVSQGALSPHLLGLEEGETLLLDPQALGFLTLRDVPQARALWLLATGTGLGPYLSMLRAGEILERFEHVILVHGVRQREELAYRSELEALCVQHTKLRYLPVLSGNTITPQGTELTGRITTTWQEGKLERAAGQSFDKECHMLLCGNPQMITEMSVMLKDAGFEKHRRRSPGHFSFEKYW